jgi:3-oxoacyl-[acyl-carrier protein] reductase
MTAPLTQADGIHAVGYVADLTDPHQVAHVVQAAAAAHSGIDILVNNAGMTQTTGTSTSTTSTNTPNPSTDANTSSSICDADELAYLTDCNMVNWQRQVQITLMTAVHTTRAALPHLRSVLVSKQVTALEEKRRAI